MLLTLIEASLVPVKQQPRILLHNSQCRQFTALDSLRRARAVMKLRHVLISTGAKVYDIAPRVRLLFHLL